MVAIVIRLRGKFQKQRDVERLVVHRSRKSRSSDPNAEVYHAWLAIEQVATSLGERLAIIVARILQFKVDGMA